MKEKDLWQYEDLLILAPIMKLSQMYYFLRTIVMVYFSSYPLAISKLMMNYLNSKAKLSIRREKNNLSALSRHSKLEPNQKRHNFSSALKGTDFSEVGIRNQLLNSEITSCCVILIRRLIYPGQFDPPKERMEHFLWKFRIDYQQV